MHTEYISGYIHDASDSGVTELLGEVVFFSDLSSDFSTRVPSGAIPHAL
jgi:hypothetical protein